MFRKVRLLARGCVRMQDGVLYLLNRRDGGWAEPSIWVGTWEELHRRFDCEVVAVGDDAFGRYWEVESK